MGDQVDLAARVWALCHVLRDDGIVYHKYLSELTYLLFLKNAKQLGAEDKLPLGCRWDDLLGHRGPGMLGFYRKLLTQLGEDADDDHIRSIFSFPTTVFSHDENLEKVVLGIEAIDWHAHNRDSLGAIYESLLERNATEARSGSGQYFTPRPLVDCLIRLTQPLRGEVIQDPAVGTGGFLIAAHRHLQAQKGGADTTRYEGVEIERDTFRLCLMNLYLHGMDGQLIHGDALTLDSDPLVHADLILANPPFGVSVGGARRRRADLPFPTANKQLMFLQYIGLALKPGGRAAVIVPDNVLFEPGVGKRVRQDLLDRFDLHTILRLPTGIFYAPNVKTNVLFFARRAERDTGTHATWFYDLRTAMPNFTKRRLLLRDDFAEFEGVFGPDPLGRSPRVESARFRSFSRDAIRDRDDDLHIQWMDEAPLEAEPDLADILAAMDSELRAAGQQLAQLASIIGGAGLAEPGPTTE